MTVVSGGRVRPVPAPASGRAAWSALAVAVALVLAGCSDDGSRGSYDAERTAHGPGGVAVLGGVLDEVSGGSGSPAPATGAGGTAAQPVVRTVGPSESLRFVTPTRNIGCLLSAEVARCDIRDHTWKAPAKPESCDFDYGSGLVVEAGRASLLCGTDTVLGGGEVLGYGVTARAGTNECVSEKVGVTCRSTATGRGFSLSRDAYRLF